MANLPPIIGITMLLCVAFVFIVRRRTDIKAIMPIWTVILPLAALLSIVVLYFFAALFAFNGRPFEDGLLLVFSLSFLPLVRRIVSPRGDRDREEQS